MIQNTTKGSPYGRPALAIFFGLAGIARRAYVVLLESFCSLKNETFTNSGT